AAADLRSARVPPLARRAGLGCGGARPARRDRRPADRRLDGMGRPAARLREARGAVRADRGLGHRLGAHVALALAPRLDVARDRRRAAAEGPWNAGARAAAVRLASLAARAKPAAQQ